MQQDGHYLATNLRGRGKTPAIYIWAKFRHKTTCMWILTDHTAVRLHGHNEGQLCYEERDTEVDVDVVPHAPQGPVGGREGGCECEG